MPQSYKINVPNSFLKGDRGFWDKILIERMPGKPVWGYSDADAHNADSHAERKWQTFILPELTQKALRHAIKK